MAFNVQQARDAGYSDAEIADYLSKETGFKLNDAKTAGYADDEIVQHLVGLQEEQGKPLNRLKSMAGSAIDAIKNGITAKSVVNPDDATTTDQEESKVASDTAFRILPSVAAQRGIKTAADNIRLTPIDAQIKAKRDSYSPENIQRFIADYTATGRDAAEAAQKLSQYKADGYDLNDVLAGRVDAPRRLDMRTGDAGQAFEAAANRTQAQQDQQERSQTNPLLAGAKDFAGQIVPGVANAIGSAVRGTDTSMPTNDIDQTAQDWIDISNHLMDRARASGANADVLSAGQSTGYSLATMAPMAAGAPGWPLAFSMMYRGAQNQFMNELRDAYQNQYGKVSDAEWKGKEAQVQDEARNYGLWEAGPEYASDLAFFGILGKTFGKEAIGNLMKRVVSGYGLEFANESGSEALTNMGQGQQMHDALQKLGVDAGRREEWLSPSDWWENYKQVAPSVALSTLALGGMGGAVHKTAQKIQQYLAGDRRLADDDALTQMRTEAEQVNQAAPGAVDTAALDAELQRRTELGPMARAEETAHREQAKLVISQGNAATDAADDAVAASLQAQYDAAPAEAISAADVLGEHPHGAIPPEAPALAEEAAQGGSDHATGGAGNPVLEQPSADPVTAETAGPGSIGDLDAGSQGNAQDGTVAPTVQSKKPWELTRDEFNSDAAYQGVNATTDESNPSYWFTDQPQEARQFAEGERGDGTAEKKTEPRIDVAYKSQLDAEFNDSERPSGSKHAYTGTTKNRPVVASIPLDAANDPHRYLVEEALKRGENVPDHVLDEYPDLKARKQRQTANASVQASFKKGDTVVINGDKDGKLHTVVDVDSEGYVNLASGLSVKPDVLTHKEPTPVAASPIYAGGGSSHQENVARWNANASTKSAPSAVTQQAQSSELNAPTATEAAPADGFGTPQTGHAQQAMPASAVDRQQIGAGSTTNASAIDNTLRPLVEQLVKRRAAASQVGRSRQFQTALDKAKAAMNGEAVGPNTFKNAAVHFNKVDEETRQILLNIHEHLNGAKEEAAKAIASAKASERMKKRQAAARRVIPEKDTMLQAIAKLGGFKKGIKDENDIRGSLGIEGNQRINIGGAFAWLFTENGSTLDGMAEKLHELGYLKAYDAQELDAKLADYGGENHSMTYVPEFDAAFEEAIKPVTPEEAAGAADNWTLAEQELLDEIQSELDWHALIESIASDDSLLADIAAEAENDRNEVDRILREFYDAIDIQESGQDQGQTGSVASREPGQGTESGRQDRGEAGSQVGEGAAGSPLESYTRQDLAARDQAAAARRNADEEARKKAEADSQRNDFTLTGSNRPADEAAARGAQDLFAQPAPKPQLTGRGSDESKLTGNHRDPNKVNIFNPYEVGDIVSINDRDWQIKNDGGWYLTTTGNWRGEHPTIKKVAAMTDLIAMIEKEAAGSKVEAKAETPAWHVKLPAEGLPITDDQRKKDGYRRVGWALAEDAYKAIKQEQMMSGQQLYAYLLPASGGRNGIVRFLPDDQTPPSPWKLVNPEGLRVGMMGKEKAVAKLEEWLRREPILGDENAQEPSTPAPAVTDSAASSPTASWVIRNKETGEVVMETFDRKKVDALNTEKYEAVPIREHLASLNNPAKSPTQEPLTTGDVFTTMTGRHTTPFPKYSKNPGKAQMTKDEVAVRQWLKDNAIAEAEARGDDFNLRQWQSLNPRNWSPADGDAVNLYLFDDETGRIGNRKVKGEPVADEVEKAKEALDAAGVTGTDRTTTIAAVRRGDLTADEVAEAHIADFGEKIGGARKDTAKPLGPRARIERETDERPVWARKFKAMQVMASRYGRPENVGKWQVMIESSTRKGAMAPASRTMFDTEQEALDAIPLIAVSRKHVVSYYDTKAPTPEQVVQSSQAADEWLNKVVADVAKLRDENAALLMNASVTQRFKKSLAEGRMTQAQYDAAAAKGTVLSDEDMAKAADIQKQIDAARDTPMNAPAEPSRKWGIYRQITDRKRALVRGGFETQAAAMAYMAEHPGEILEHKFQYPERPWLDKIERVGEERRTGDVTTKMFQDTFGFRAGEFGNWNMGGDGQAALNHAYDALLDLADSIGVPPKAISLDGELAIAFGARGTGGKNSAAAHYEPGAVVINLTKIKGAGSAAHEWWHAVDHYFARNGGRKESHSVVANDFAYNSTARPELIEAIKNVVDAMMRSERSTTTDADLVRKRAQKRIDESLSSLNYYLNDLRQPYKPKKPFTAEQLKQFDALADKLRAGELGDEVYIENPSKMRGAMGFMTGTNIRDLNALYKAATGRSFMRQDPESTGRRMYWSVKAIEDNLKSLYTQDAVTTTSKGASNYLIEARRIDSEHVGDYWSSPEEMGARAFEAYVFDRLLNDGKRSDYLVHGVENKFYAAMDMRPYPEGEERQRINAAFDRLFDTIQTKETDRGVAMFSRSGKLQLDGAAFGPRDMGIRDLVRAAIDYARAKFAGGKVSNISDGTEILIGAQGIKHALSGQVSRVSALAMSRLDEIVARAQYVRSEPDKAGRNTIKEVRFYELPVSLDGKDSMLRVVVRVAADGNRYYDHFEIEDPAGQSGKSASQNSLQPFAGSASDESGNESVGSDGSDVNFKRDGLAGLAGMTKAETQAIVDAIRARWSNAPEIIVVDDMTDSRIRKAVRDENERQMSQGAEGVPEGFFDAGKVYIVASAMEKPGDVVRVLFHETLGHYGLRGAFGESLTPILKSIVMLRRKEVLAKARQYGLTDSQKDLQIAAEEVLAEMAQTNPQLGFVKRAIAAIRAWLRDHVPGFTKMILTDEDIISQYLMPARAFVQAGGKFEEGMLPAFQRVWHGSPHRFDKFSLEHIGNGEGAQAFGWGLYFADQKDIAEHYRKGLSYREIVREFREELPDDADFDEALDAAETMTPVRARVIRALAADDWLGFDYPAQAITAAFKGMDGYDVSDELRAAVDAAQGQLYEVEIPEDDTFLLWDKPLSEQPEKVRQALGVARKFAEKAEQGGISIKPIADNVLVGEGLYGALERAAGSAESASKYLHSLGINGIKYLDGTSRGAGDGSFNYVVFDDNAAEIVQTHFSRAIQTEAMASRKDAVVSGSDALAPGAAGGVAITRLNKVMRASGWEVEYVDMDLTGERPKADIRIKRDDGRFIIAKVDSIGRASFETFQREHNLRMDDSTRGRRPLSPMVDDTFLGRQKFEGARSMLRGMVNYLTDNATNPVALADMRSAWAGVMAAPTQQDTTKLPAAEGGMIPTFSRRGQSGNLFPANTFEAPDASKMDSVIYALQDKNIDLKRVTQEIKKAGRDIADRWNAYLQEELYHGRTAKRTKDFITEELDPLIQDMRMRGVKMADFEEYLWARHAEERNAQIAKINPDMPDGGSGMTTQEARDYLDGLEPAKRRAYEALAKRVDAINRKSRQVLVDYGLESAETIKAWESAYEHYVPLQREDMDHGFGNGTGQGFSVRGNASKRATGSGRKVVDILANIAQQREKNIIRGEKNRVATALVGLAKLNPNPDFWKTDTPPKIRDVSKITGLVEERADPNYKNRDNVIVARIGNPDGRITEHSVLFNEHDERAMRMAHSLKNLDQDQIGELLGTAGMVTRYFASINTQYNPIFGIVNIVRDVQGAMLNLSSTPLAGKQKEVLSHTMAALRGIYSDIRAERKGNAPASAYAQEWEEFQKEGGQTGYRDMYKNARDRAAALEHALDPEWWQKKTWGKVVSAGGILAAPEQWIVSKPGKAVFDWLADYNETMENAVRLAAYKVAKDNGLSKQQAASVAKNLTVNFNKKGAMARQVGALYAFFNASVQGTARIAETLTGPAGKKIIAGGLLLGSMQAIALALAGFGDDEPPEFVRDRSLIIPIGGGKYLTIPMPLGFNALPAFGRIVTEWALDGFSDPAKRAVHVINMLLDVTNPIGNAGLSMQTIAPTALDPIAALTENKDWTGRPIARQDFNSLDPTPGHARAKDTATALSRALSYGINAMSGGTDYRPGALSPTPDQIDYLGGQLGGGVWREFSKLEQFAMSAYTGEEIPTYKIPLVGRFYGDANGKASQGAAFYNNLRELNEHENEIKGRRKAGEDVAGYRKDHPEATLIPMANLAERQVSALRKHQRMLVEKGAPKDQVEKVNERITAVMKRLNDQVKARKEKAAND